MKIRHEVRYDAPPADVYAMLTDPVFREKASKAQGTTSTEVSVAGGDVRIEMVQPNTDIPAFARAIAGDSVRAIQSEHWSDGTTADFVVDSPGKPVAITGVRRLVADGAATLDTFDGEARASVPLIGGRIEKLVAKKLTDGWDTEHGVGVRWLAGDR